MHLEVTRAHIQVSKWMDSALWFRNNEENQGPVSMTECLVMVKQILAVLSSGVEQSEFWVWIWFGLNVTEASTITMGLDLDIDRVGKYILKL